MCFHYRHITGMMIPVICPEGTAPTEPVIDIDMTKLAPVLRTVIPAVKTEPAPGGLGDLVARALSAIGIKKRKGCNCEKRRQALNAATPTWARQAIASLAPGGSQPAPPAGP